MNEGQWRDQGIEFIEFGDELINYYLEAQFAILETKRALFQSCEGLSDL